MKKQMKKILCVVLSILMTFSYAVPAFAGSIDNTHLSTKQSDVKSDAEVKAVEKKIDAIGKVHYTDKSLAKIIVAENAYNALSDKQKSNVSNYGALKAARNAYNALAADNIDTSSYTITDKGSLSDNVNWFVYDNGLLEITGKGKMPSYSKGNAPWYQYKDTVTSILVRSSITGIGDSAFYGCDSVTEITLPFVGASRDAVGYSCSFGYIFGYSASSTVSGSKFDSDFAPGYGYKASSGYNGSYYYYQFSVPSSLKKVTVTDATRIGKGAFHECAGISEIVLNDGITSIGDYAFYNCSIKDFAIPNYVETLGKYAFYNCKNLQEIFIPNSVTAIDTYTFYGCNGIIKLNISENVTTIGDYAFYDCSSLTELNIPARTESVGSYAFAECRRLKKINIPDSVTNLGEGAFSSETSMSASDLIIGSGLNAIPQKAFKNCKALTTINVPKTVTSIGDSAFYGCDSVTEITLPFVGASRDAIGYSCSFGYIFGYSASSTVSGSKFDSDFAPGYGYKASSGYNGSYYYYQFSVPSSLKKVTVTDATRIGKGAFHECTGISEIILNDGITSIGDYAFQSNPWYDNLTDEFVTVGDNVLIKYNGTKSSVTIPNTVKHIGGGVFKNNNKISEVILPNELLSIGDNALKGTALSTVTIPRSVTKIGTNAFPSCDLKVYQPSAGYDYDSSNKTVLNGSYTKGNDTFYYITKSDDTAEIIGCETTSTELTVPEEIDGHAVSAIGDYGFAKCATLKSITIPKNIKTIGKYAFNGCTGLINATIPTTVSSVGDYAFNNCTGLKNVTISEGVESIGKGCFYNCTSLAEAVVPDTAKYVGAYAFYNCTSMVNATIGTTTESIGECTFYNCERLETVVIGYSVKSIGDYAFYNCALGRVSVPSATTVIGNFAFAKNSNLTKATLRKNLLTIGDGAFKDCGLLSSISIPTTVTSIGNEAFENCTSIASVTIPTGVTEIKKRTFSNCSSLANVTIKGEVTSIGESAFFNNAFTAIQLPETLKTIGSSAFKNCGKLEKITLPNSTADIGNAVFLNCSALYLVSVPDSVGSVGQNVFFYNDDITVEIRKNSGTVADKLLAQQGVHHVILDENISTIGKNVFDSCYELSTVTYGNETVKSGEYKLSKSIKAIGSGAFKDNPLLRNLIVPDTLETIGNYAFRSCSSITEITIPDSVTQLGDCVFYACTGLEKAEFGTGIVKIGNSEFYGCVKFTELYLYGNVNNIHDLAFYGAEDAEVYTYPNSYVEDYCNDNGLVYHEIGNITSVSLTPPAKTEYVENDKLDTAGMKFNVTYDNGYERTVTSGLKITGFDSENVGKQTVTVSYRGKSATFEVNVSEKKVVDAEFEFPNDIKIIQGEDLDLNSGKVILTYSDGSQQTIKKGYTVTGFDKTKVGKQNITITYRDFSTDLEVTVEEKQEPEHTHNWSDWKYNNDAVYNSSSDYKDGTQTRTCSACGESETKEAPNTALLRRRGNALSLESSITLATYITKDVVDYYDEVYAEFTRNGKTEKVYSSGKTLASGSTVYCVFDYTGISPQALGDNVSITFYGVKDGVTYNGNAYKYSATDYIKLTLNKPTSSAKLKTLLVDLVYYGEACQVYQNYKTDNLLTDILTDEQKALHSTDDLNLTNIKNASYETCENRLVKFGTALRLNNSVEIAIPLNMTNVALDDLSFKVKIGSRTLTYTYAENPDNFEKGKDGYWYFYFDGVYANQMSDEVFITAYKGDEQVSYTLKYSVESYAATVTDAKLKAVTDAMMRYGNSAKAYAGK